MFNPHNPSGEPSAVSCPPSSRRRALLRIMSRSIFFFFGGEGLYSLKRTNRTKSEELFVGRECLHWISLIDKSAHSITQELKQLQTHLHMKIDLYNDSHTDTDIHMDDNARTCRHTDKRQGYSPAFHPPFTGTPTIPPPHPAHLSAVLKERYN